MYARKFSKLSVDDFSVIRIGKEATVYMKL